MKDTLAPSVKEKDSKRSRWWFGLKNATDFYKLSSTNERFITFGVFFLRVDDKNTIPK